MPPTIRDARPEDAEAIARLLGQLGYPVAADAIPARLDVLEAIGDRVAVAVTDDRVVGLAHLHVAPLVEDDRPAARLSAIVVDVDCRGAGVGRALTEHMQAEARRRGCAQFFLTTAERRPEAHAFYERLGLEQTGRRYGTSLD